MNSCVINTKDCVINTEELGMLLQHFLTDSL